MIYFAKIHFGFFRIAANPGHACSFLPEFERELFYVKIGKADRPEARLRSLATTTGRPVTLLAAIPGGEGEEADMHERFGHLRLEGLGRAAPEWFHPTRELMGFIEELRAATPPGPIREPDPHAQKFLEFGVD